MANKKNLVEIMLMPIVVALVGIVGTCVVTHQQELNAQAKAYADRQIKLLEILGEKITSKDESERILALSLLSTIDGDLAAKLAKAVAETEPEASNVRKVADKVVEEATARARLLPRVYIHIQKHEDRPQAEKASRFLKENGIAVAGIERVGIKAPGVTQLRYFRKAEKNKAEQIKSKLETKLKGVELQYISGYERSRSIRPMHFELWFARSNP